MSEALAYEPQDDLEEEGPAPFDLMAAIQSPNIAEDLSPALLATIGDKVLEEYKIDEESRRKEGWDERYQTAMDLAMLVAKQKSFPWPGASNVKHPLLATAAIQFNARAYGALIDGPIPVKGSVKGSDRGIPQMGPDGQPQMDPQSGEPVWQVKPGAKRERADRIGAHMSYQIMEEMPGWEEDTDRLLIQNPIVGCSFRKSWFDPMKGCNRTEMVTAKDFVVNYWTKDLETCPRGTHVLTFYPHEVTERIRAKTWLDVDLGRPAEAANDDQAPYTFYEQFRLIDLDEDEYPEPYIVTVEKESGQVVRIVARFDERGVYGPDGKRAEIERSQVPGQPPIVKYWPETIARIEPERSFTKWPFIPAMDGSYYDIGFGMLLGSTVNSVNTVLNQLFDAGTLSNLGGGFIGEGISIKSGNMTRRPGEWKKAAVGNGGSLRENVVPFPTQDPSRVLLELLVFLIDGAKDLTATQDILGGDAGKGTLPVGTVSALIEQGLKTFTAIVKRLHRAFKDELGILYRLNARYLEPEAYFTFQDEEGVVAQDDYKLGDCDVVPVSDPNMATDMQRTTKAQATMEIAKEAGGDMRVAGLRALEAFRVDAPEEIFPKPQGPPPEDPALVKAKADAEMDDRRTQIEAAEAASNIAAQTVETEAKKLELAMMAPQFMAAIEQAIQAGIQRALQLVENGGQPPVQQGAVPGMDQPPGNPDVPGPPQGGAELPGGPMGAGPGDGPPPADQGAPMDGAFDPEMA
jgi:chaperonin GroES